jgi:hypothetical protein
MGKYIGIAQITFPNGTEDAAVMPLTHPDGTETYYESREACVKDMEKAFNDIGLKALMPGMKVFTAEISDLVEFEPTLTGTKTVTEAIADESNDLW